MNIQVIKNKVDKLYKRRTYDYLLDNVLYSNRNPDKLRERVKEMYFELLEFSDIPDIGKMAEILDSENIFIIVEFYKEKHTESEIDDILAIYNHDIACMLDEWVHEILTSWGYACKGNPFYIFEKRNYDITLVAQNTLMKRITY